MFSHRSIYAFLSIFFVNLLFMATAHANTFPEYVFKGSQVHHLQAQQLDQIYELRIALPASYNTEQSYPVIYVLDGQWSFTMVADILGKTGYDAMTPEAIVVAITWGGEGDDPNQLRQRDFTHTPVPGVELSGGASTFLSVIESEIMPYIDNQFSTSDQQVLMGASLGGLFTSFALFEKPGLFDGYIALSAPYFYEADYFASKLAEYADTRALAGTRLYLSVGSLDFNKTMVEDFFHQLTNVRLKGFKKKKRIYNGIGHAGVEPLAYTKGLQYIFKRPKLKLPLALLESYEGTYTSFPGLPVLTIGHDGENIVLHQDGAEPLTFFAQSEDTFYYLGANYSLRFYTDENNLPAFEINVQGQRFPFSLNQ